MKVVTSYNNFSRAKIDHDMQGRFDLPIYVTSADEFWNHISNFKGNAIYRTGFESMLEFQDCVLIEFKFTNSQNYLCLFYANTIRFLSYDINGEFGFVLNGGATPLEVTTPYTLAECRVLDYTQKNDAMVLTKQGQQPRKLIRTSANTFTCNTFARKDDPFGLTYDATKAITGATQAANANLTIVAHGYSVGDMIKLAGITGMTELNGWTARVVTVPGANNVTIDVDTRTYTAYTAGGTSAELLTGDFPACCCFYNSRLYYAATTAKITTVWGSESALYDIFTVPTTATDTSAFVFTLADISQLIEWLFPGENSLIAGASDGIVAMNGGSVGAAITTETFKATISSAEGCNGAYPVKKDGFIFYVGRNNRNIYYFSYDILTETFGADDSNFISYDITKGGLTKIRHKKDRNDLIFALRGDGDMCTLNFNKKENIIGWHEQFTSGEFLDEAVITDNEGNPQIFALVLRNGDYFIERQAEYVEFGSRVDFYTGKDQEEVDQEAYYRYIAEQLKECNYLDNSQSVSNLKSNSITYNPTTGRITANSAVFVIGDEGKHIVYKTETGYESGRFLIDNYISTTVVEVSVLQEPTTNTYVDWYLSFNSISGLTQYEGQTISVVTDGGYLSDFVVTGGEIELNSQVTHAIVGYKYLGLIKSFSLGFQVQGSNTQTTFKAVSRVGLRFTQSVGGKFGTSRYNMEPVQELGQSDLNYLPALPMDGTKYINYVDDNTLDKYFYIVQDEPGPLNINCVMIEANYTTSS